MSTPRRFSSSLKALFLAQLRLAVILSALAGAAAVSRAATIAVAAGGDFQAALNAAQPGDTIVLEAGATYRGPFDLPKKGGDSYITVRSSRLAELPEGVRVTPAQAALMPRLVAPAYSYAVKAVGGAHHYRFEGIEFFSPEMTYHLIFLGGWGAEQDTLDEVPHHFQFDRTYVHAGEGEAIRGILLNSAHTDVTNSHVSGFKSKGFDSQAVGGVNGPGPYRIINNYLEGAGENLMFGGADPSIPNLVPSDIEVRRNHFAKPLAWRGVWIVKNLFELKNARRVTVDGNTLENNWVSGQAGMAILFTPRNQDGNCNWCVVEDVEFTNNIVRHAGGGINILGRDYFHPSEQTKRIRIANNLFEDINGATYGGNGIWFQMTGGSADITVDHNTVDHSGNFVALGDAPHTGFRLTNNVARHNEYGIYGDGVGSGTAALVRYTPGAVVAGNVIAGADASRYPAGNFYPASLGGSFVGTDGRPSGCDVEALRAAQGGAAVTPPPGAPAVSITTPTNAATLSAGAYVSINAAAAASSGDSAISRVDFYADGQFVGATAVAPYNVLWAGAGVGSHVLTAKATDSRGVSAVSSPVVVNVAVPANSPPAVSITGPTANKEFNEGDNVSAVEAGGHDLPLKEKGAKKPERRRTRGYYSTASPAAKRHNQKSSGAKKPK